MLLELRPLSLLAGTLLATATAVASDWPAWRGPGQDGVSAETGLVSAWSVKGENLLWRVPFAGRSTPVVLDGRVCVSGREGQGPTRRETVACFDAATGERLWQTDFPVYLSTVPFNRASWASPVFDAETGHLYHQGVGGLLACLDRAGRLVWSRSLGEELGRFSGFGGRTHTPLVFEDLLVVSVINTSWGRLQPPRHRTYAFDKRDGRVIWIATPGAQPEDLNTQSDPVLTRVGSRDLLVGGNADGAVYALHARTGEPVWSFRLSKRGLNSSVVAADGRVYAAHSEENLDGAVMGRVVAIDATGTGDVTATHELWRADGLTVGFASPALHAGRIYLVDNSANLHALEAASGKTLWTLDLGTVGKGSPLWADGKLYITEVNGRFHIVAAGDEASERRLDTEQIRTGDRHAEIYGSPAIAGGRIYFTSEEGLYCLGRSLHPAAPAREAPAGATRPAATRPVGSGEPASILVVPAEVLVAPGEAVTFEVRAFDSGRRPLGVVPAAWSPGTAPGSVTTPGRFVADAKPGFAAGELEVRVGPLGATARVRVCPRLPWSEDFESYAPGSRLVHAIGAGRYEIAERDGGRVLLKPPPKSGLDRSDLYLGPASLSGYTVQIDLLGTSSGPRLPDMGVINSGYSLELQGSHQVLLVDSWPSVKRVATTAPFPWRPDAWYTMKLRVEVEAAAGPARVSGKVWPRGEAEPAAWTLVVEDPFPVRAGSPGITGASPTDILYDNLKVWENE